MDATPTVEPEPEPFTPEAGLSTLEQLEAELTELEAALARVDDGTAETTGIES